MNGAVILMHSRARVRAHRPGADTRRVIWLVLTCCGLVALWGASESWNLHGLGRRLAHAARGRRRRSTDAPSTSASPDPAGPTAPGVRW